MTKRQLKQDIDKALQLLYGSGLDNYKEELRYNQIYPWSNEGIDEYYNYSDLSQKQILTITASGDHIIYAAEAGAKEIDAIDINRLAKYYAALKIAAIKAYSEDEFIDSFIKETNIQLNDLKQFLTKEEFTFWKEILATNLLESNYYYLFRNDGVVRPFHLDYEKAQKRLKETQINYFDVSFKFFAKRTQKRYDAIFLSNIIEWDNEQKTEAYIKKALELSNPNGIIYDYFIQRNPEEELYCNIPYETLLPCRIKTDLHSGVYIYQKK